MSNHSGGDFFCFTIKRNKTMDYLKLASELLAGLVGFPTLLAAAINIAKHFGLPDGRAGTVSFVVHLIAYIGVAVAVFLGKVDILQGIDLQLGNVANVLLTLLAFLVSLRNAREAHWQLRDVPLVGYSHTRVDAF
jgi:2-methylisocitrate lyase-like PEP mutase family enzyme